MEENGDDLEIEHDGKRYERNRAYLKLVSTDFREEVGWHQGLGSPPEYFSTIEGTARIDGGRLAVLGDENSEIRQFEFTLEPVSDETLAHYRSVINLSRKSKTLEIKPDEIARSWPLHLYSNDGFVVYLPRADYEKVRMISAPRMEISIEIPTYAELGPSLGPDLLLDDDRTRPFGRCADLRFVLEGAERFATPNTDDDETDDAEPQTVPVLLAKIERRLGEVGGHLKGVQRAIIWLVVAAVAVALIHGLFG
ncbi:MAG TPA: hypothetical protein PLH75_11095 [Amaricoccus sp.]|uniref:hypothetical protein n=1 Tax=Amaricoccus sp. TaxID=1872485 RepID=UPI001D8B0847|nr:hypothetical protein [Amaricoccus sp.]MCB1402718.1 hypothetical protein [Paracoccaceae bacterium]HPG23320.1 hypothetical protein [Amaricoccus sp.]HRW16652.1 hypothetical protein [Amaricoccus sp.]